MALRLQRWTKGAGIIALAVALAGCSAVPFLKGERDPNPPTKLSKIDQQVSIERLWSQRHDKGTRGQRLYLVPALADERIYIADHRGTITAVDSASGRQIWRQQTPFPFSAGPVVAGDRLVLGSSAGDLAVLSSRDGQVFAQAQIDSEILSLPQVTQDGVIIVHALDDSIHALALADAKEVWRIDYHAPILTLRGSSTPALTPDGVIVGLSGGKLTKLATNDGFPLWEVVVTYPHGRSEIERIADIDADPVIAGETVYIGTYNGDLAAVDTVTGEVRWRRELSSHAGLATDGTNLYITDSTDQLWAANASDGAGQWKQNLLRYRGLTAPTLLGEMIAVGDSEGYLHLISQTDGHLLGRVRVTKKAGITARPLAVGQRLYVYAEDGTLAAYRIGPATAISTTSATTAAQPATLEAEAPSQPELPL